MRSLIERADRLVRAAQQRQVQRLAGEWRERMPEAQVSADGSAVIIEGRGLARRWLSEPLLRFVGHRR